MNAKVFVTPDFTKAILLSKIALRGQKAPGFSIVGQLGVNGYKFSNSVKTLVSDADLHTIRGTSLQITKPTALHTATEVF